MPNLISEMINSGSKFMSSLAKLVSVLKSPKSWKALAWIVAFLCVLGIFAHITGIKSIRWFKNSEATFTKTEVIELIDSLNKCHKIEIANVIDSLNSEESTKIIKDIERKAELVQPKIDALRDKYKVDLVEIYLFHDGEVTLSRLHKLKATKFFLSKTDKYPSNSFRENIPLYPYVAESTRILKDGEIYVEDTKTTEYKTRSAYILSRMAYNENTRTFLLIPILSEDGTTPIGCLTLNYQDKPHKLSQEVRCKITKDASDIAFFVRM